MGFAGFGGVALAFAEHLVEGANLAEEDVAVRAADLAVGADVVGPEEPAIDVVGLGMEVLEVDRVCKRMLDGGGDVGAEASELGLPSGADDAEAEGEDSEVVGDGAREVDFLEGRGADVAAGKGEAEVRGAIGWNLEGEGRADAVGAAVGVGEEKVVGGGGGEGEVGERGEREVGGDEERDGGGVGGTGNEGGHGDGLVELEREGELAALDGGDAAGVVDVLGGLLGVGGVGDVGDGTFELRILKDGDLEVGGVGDVRDDAVGERVGDAGDGAAEDGVGEVADEGDLLLGLAGDHEDEVGVLGKAIEAGEDGQGRAELDFGVAGGDFEVFAMGKGRGGRLAGGHGGGDDLVEGDKEQGGGERGEDGDGERQAAKDAGPWKGA